MRLVNRNSRQRAASIAKCPGRAGRPFRLRSFRTQLLRVAVVGFALAEGAAAAAVNDSPGSVVTADYQADRDGRTGGSTSPLQSARNKTPIRRTEDAQSDGTNRRRLSSPASTLVTLGAILGATYFVLLWFKRRAPGQDTTSSEAIDILCTRQLDGHTTMHLVRIGRRVVAVGSTSGGARTLATIDDPEEIALLVSDGQGLRLLDRGLSRSHMAGGRASAPRATAHETHRRERPASSSDAVARRSQ